MNKQKMPLNRFFFIILLSFAVMPVVRSDEGGLRIITKQEIRDFIQVMETEPRLQIINRSRELFKKGAFLGDGYDFVMSDYKVKSDFETMQYVFLEEPAFGNILWRISIEVKKSSGEILDFYAGAKKQTVLP